MDLASDQVASGAPMAVRLEQQAARHWSTEQVDPRHALAYWVDTICDRFLELEIDTPLRQRFQASLDQTDLGPATANFIRADIQRVRRTRAKISSMSAPLYVLLQLRVGHIEFRQLGRETRVGPGECVFIDGTEPYELECPQPTSALALRLPAQWLGRWLARPEHLAGRRFGATGWSAALCAALASLEIESCDQLALTRDQVAEQVASLLTLAVGNETPSSTAHLKLFDQLMRTLKGRFHEPDLSLTSVAAEHGISKRTLYYAFADAGTTFVHELMRLRLERARQLLSDRSLSVTEVAVRCGFNDSSHFARRFRQQFGLAPAQLRRSAAPTKLN
jgi:AraC family transcriptional regulator, positive regulator of tynA and feaB